MKNVKLFTPGPTAVPPEVLATQAKPLIHHRTEAFRSAHVDVLNGLQYIMRTKNPVVVLASSGTGAMEAAVVNLTRPGDKVLVTVLGKFSARWREIASAFGLNVVTVEADWGKPVAVNRLEDAFAEHPDASALFTTHSETSTGVLQDVAAFARIAREHDALVIVDAISSIAAHDVRTDEWGLDAVVGGAQKGVMTPPGLSYLSLSSKAIQKMEAGRHPCYYFDLLAAVRSAEEGNTPYTPATSLVLALQEALRIIREEGIERVVARHAANAAAVRAAVNAVGFKLFASSPCNATTVTEPPEGTAGTIIKTMETEYGVKVAGGQGPLKGKVVRLGHLGHYNADDMHTMVSAFESALKDVGIVDTKGAGVEAMRRSFTESDK